MPRLRRLTVQLSAAALAALRAHAPASADGAETGGILLGHDRGTELDVTQAGGPGPNAERREDRFRRDIIHAQELALDAWAADSSVWIGEWHTHVHWSARPSPLDLHTYRTLLADPALGFARFLGLILTPTGPASTLWRATAWIVTQRAVRRVRLRT